MCVARAEAVLTQRTKFTTAITPQLKQTSTFCTIVWLSCLHSLTHLRTLVMCGRKLTSRVVTVYTCTCASMHQGCSELSETVFGGLSRFACRSAGKQRIIISYCKNVSETQWPCQDCSTRQGCPSLVELPCCSHLCHRNLSLPLM